MTDWVLVRNPNSGDGTRTRRAKGLALSRGYDVRDSTGGDATAELAAEAAREGATHIAACGGDGTLNKVVRGVREAYCDGPTEPLPDDVTLAVVPGGTGNDFADNLGIRGLEHAFALMAGERGDTRRLDLGFADGRPFLNSCVAGLTADASARTSRPMKRRLGVLAYVLSTLQEYPAYDPLRLDLHAGPVGGNPVWSGEALMLLVGNGRRFPGEQPGQANMEDGLLNVVVVRDAPTLDYLARGAADRFFRRGASHLTRIKVPHLRVETHADPVAYSLDGEMAAAATLDLRCLPGAMSFRVAEGYDPSPEEWGRRL